MKKIILTIMMVVWANGMLAQTQETEENVLDTVEIQSDQPKVKQQSSSIDYDLLVRTFQKYAADAQNEERPPTEPIQHYRKDWFSRHIHSAQRLEISVVGGIDGDSGDSSTLKDDYKNADDEQDAIEGGGQFNHGLSGGYSYVMLFGRTDKNNMFTPNNFGFAVNTGFIFAYDRQKRYDTTFDFLWKLGLEAGYQHTMGVELDFLLGTGKTCGDYVFTTNDENNPEIEVPYTSWCMKYGFQLSLRSNILRMQIKDTDVRLFVRYVYSKNPENEQELWNDGVDCLWKEESWSFGLSFCYSF